MKASIASAILFAAVSAFAVTEGWDNINPSRTNLPPQKVYWMADLDSAKLELREGAEGLIRVVEESGKKKLVISKMNDKGYALVTFPKFSVKSGTKMRVYGYCECYDGDPELGNGYMRLWGKKEDLSYYMLKEERRDGGPYMQKMVNSPKGGSIRKLAYREADRKTGTNITVAIVVSGPPCTSRWSDIGVEDYFAARNAWRNCKRTPDTIDLATAMQPADLFDAALAADIEHTAKIVKVDGLARLLIDGKKAAPVIYRGKVSSGTATNITYAGGLHDAKGMHLQSMTVRFGKNPRNPSGIWTKDAFDAKAGADLVRTLMRLAPKSNFILGLRLDAYPEWVNMHPGEEWLLQDGRKVYGHHVHASQHISEKKPKNKWYWPSYHSVVWREDVKGCLTKFIDELKAQGLSKRIVGVHLAGYHDAQFATRHPDFSKCAVAGFVEWQKKFLGKVKWTEAPKYGDADYLDPVANEHEAAYLRFMKQGPFHAQEDIARHIRKTFGKDIIVGRYCMSWGAAMFNGALDLDPFALSDSVDFLVAQPSYTHRLPGVAIGSRIPTRTFHDNGKLFVNEFDLRTYGGVLGGESEQMTLRLSQAVDFPMWESIHHKLAGQMMAQRMGWWYIDMSGRWFSPPEIVEDMAKVNSQVLAAECADKWMPSAAVATDESGLLLRNAMKSYYSGWEGAVQNQIRAFASSGVPHDSCLIDDFLRHPERAERYRVLFISGMHHKDMKRKTLLERLGKKGVKCVFLSRENPVSPLDFHKIVKESGGYVPADYGLEVDMNGSFVSVHALKTGRFDFKLPRRCTVRNMKTAKIEVKDATVLPLDLLAGETCWFSLD